MNLGINTAGLGSIDYNPTVKLTKPTEDENVNPTTQSAKTPSANFGSNSLGNNSTLQATTSVPRGGDWNAVGATAADNSVKLTDPDHNKIVNTNDRSVLDHHQAVNGMLPGQITNSRSVFMKHKEGDREFLAYKYQDEKGGDLRSGKRELDPTTGKFKSDWQAIDKGSKLATDLDTAHQAKMKEIERYTNKGEDRSKGVERYRAAKSLEQDIKDFKKPGLPVILPDILLDSNQKKLNTLESELKDSQKDPIKLRKQFDTSPESQELRNLLAVKRAEGLKNASLTEQVKSTVTLDKNGTIDKAVETQRDKQQKLTDAKEKEQLDTDMAALRGKISKLSDKSDLQTKSLKEASEKLLAAHAKNDSTATHGKYMQGELAYLNSQLDALGTDGTPKVPDKTIPTPSSKPKVLPPPPTSKFNAKPILTTPKDSELSNTLPPVPGDVQVVKTTSTTPNGAPPSLNNGADQTYDATVSKLIEKNLAQKSHKQFFDYAKVKILALKSNEKGTVLLGEGRTRTFINYNGNLRCEKNKEDPDDFVRIFVNP